MKWLYQLLGMGSAKVELTLNHTKFVKGKAFAGNLIVIGGKVPQEVMQIKAHICTKISTGYEEDDIETLIVQTTSVKKRFTTAENQREIIPIEFSLSDQLPFTAQGTPVFVLVNIEFDYGLGKSAYVPFELEPLPWERDLLEYISSLGLKFTHAAMEAVNKRKLYFIANHDDATLKQAQLVITYVAERVQIGFFMYLEEDSEPIRFEVSKDNVNDIKKILKLEIEKQL